MAPYRMLDLFCGAGMGSDGYVAAGFEVVGIDINAQPDYPYDFIQGDAMTYLADVDFLADFDFIHTSAPCQMHTRAKHLRTAQGGTSKYPDLLTPALALLRAQDVPWVAENVPGAPGLEGAAVECGSAYGLGVRRHRLFLSDAVALVGSGCKHKEQGRPWGVYHVMNDQVPSGGRTALNLEHGLEVMGVKRVIPWNSLKEGFPPAYTKHIGEQLLAFLSSS
jgi:DNA (cytosine-5)-methyltransferase 1